MKQLDSRVNVVPVIGKADIVAKHELNAFKKRIRAELLNNGVNVYQFPTGGSLEGKFRMDRSRL